MLRDHRSRGPEVDRQLQLRDEHRHHAAVPRRRHVLPARAVCPSGRSVASNAQPAATTASSSCATPRSASRAGSTSGHLAFLVAFALVTWRAGDPLHGAPRSSTEPRARRYRRGFMPAVLDIEQAVAAPGARAAVRQARRPARAPAAWPSAGTPTSRRPGKQLEHERHLKAINEAADQLERSPRTRAAGASRATPSRSAPRPRASAAPRRARRAYEAEQRRRAAEADRAKHDPFGSRVPDHSVVHRYARCLSYPEWGVGTRQRHLLHRRRRRHPAVGAREVPAGRAHRPGRLAAVRRLLQARPGRRARPALHDRRPARAGRGRLQARRAAARSTRATPSPRNTSVLRLMTLAFWQAGDLDRRRARRARLGPRRAASAPRRTASPRASTRTWARSTSPPRRPSAPRPARPRTPTRGSASGACGCG